MILIINHNTFDKTSKFKRFAMFADIKAETNTVKDQFLNIWEESSGFEPNLGRKIDY